MVSEISNGTKNHSKTLEKFAQLGAQLVHHALAGKAVGHALKEGGGGGVGGHDRPRL